MPKGKVLTKSNSKLTLLKQKINRAYENAQYESREPVQFRNENQIVTSGSGTHQYQARDIGEQVEFEELQVSTRPISR